MWEQGSGGRQRQRCAKVAGVVRAQGDGACGEAGWDASGRLRAA